MKKEPFAFERRREPLIPRREFLLRLARSAAFAGSLLLGSLGIGVAGYHAFVGLPWLDALVNASMILSGMGPVDAVHSAAGKWFASGYAIFSGVMFLTSVGVLLAPVAHRFLHHFHLDIEE